MLSDSCSGSINTRRASAEAGNFFFQPVQFHVEPADLLEQLGFAGLLCRGVLYLIARLKQARRAQEQLLLPLMDLRRMDVEERGQLLNRLLLFNSRQSDLGLELGAPRRLLPAAHDSLP